MPNPLSTDIRARFEVLFAQGLTGREIGRRLMISAASASRLSQRLKRGLCLTPAAPFGSWGTQTLIAGLGPSDLIAPWVIKGAMDGPAFVADIRDVLIPKIAPGTAVILDNLATHRNKEAEDILCAHRMEHDLLQAGFLQR